MPERGRITEIRAYYASPLDPTLTVLELGGFDYAGRGYPAWLPKRSRAHSASDRGQSASSAATSQSASACSLSATTRLSSASSSTNRPGSVAASTS